MNAGRNRYAARYSVARKLAYGNNLLNHRKRKPNSKKGR